MVINVYTDKCTEQNEKERNRLFQTCFKTVFVFEIFIIFVDDFTTTTEKHYSISFMKHWNIKWMQYLAFTCLLLVSCSSSHDEEPDPVPPVNPENPTTTSKFGLERQSVLDYFSSVLKGEDNTYTAESSLTATDVTEATDYVWDLWRTAVKRAPESHV